MKKREHLRYLAFVVQSSIINGKEITKRIETFINNEIDNILNNLNKKEFNSFKNGIIVRKLEPDQSLTNQAGRFWSEIISNRGILVTTDDCYVCI